MLSPQRLDLDTGNIDLICVNDNAANQKLGVKLTAGLLQYLCDNHTMELAVKDTFTNVPGMSNVLRKSKGVSKFTHDSCPALEQLKSEARKEKIPFRKLKNPPNTRWSGRLDNLKSVQHLKKPLQNLADEKEEWADHAITRNEWKQIEGAVKVLTPVKAMIKKLETEKEPTMHEVTAELFKIHHILQSFINNRNNCGFGIEFARELKKQIEKRFPDRGTDRQERRIANYLAPQYRGAHLGPVGKLESTKDEIKEKVKDEGTENETENEDDILLQRPTNVELSPTSKLIRQHEERLKGSHTNNTEKSKVEREMDRYERFSNPGQNVNVLKWWKAREDVLPLLANQAKKVLAIPSSSSKSERVFSTGGNFVTAKRSRIAPKKVENLVVIKENKDKVEDFEKNGGYKLEKITGNPFKEIAEEIRPIQNDEDIFGDTDDLEEEEAIMLDDYSDTEDESEDDQTDSEQEDDDYINFID